MDNEVLFRDNVDIQPMADLYATNAATQNIYTELPTAQFIKCESDIWSPAEDAEIDGAQTAVQVKTKRQILLQKVKKRVIYVLDHNISLFFIFVMTFWALFAEDLQFGAPLDKNVDYTFAIFTLIFLIVFMIEFTARSIAQYDEFCFSFFWLMELVANMSMLMALGPLYTNQDSCDEALNISNLDGLAAGSRLARVMRLLRVIRVLRVFASCSKRHNKDSASVKNQQSAIGKALNEKLVRSMILIVIALQVCTIRTTSSAGYSE